MFYHCFKSVGCSIQCSSGINPCSGLFDLSKPQLTNFFRKNDKSNLEKLDFMTLAEETSIAK